MNFKLDGAHSFVVLLVVISLPDNFMRNIHGEFRPQTHQHPHKGYHVFHKSSKYGDTKEGEVVFIDCLFSAHLKIRIYYYFLPPVKVYS